MDIKVHSPCSTIYLYKHTSAYKPFLFRFVVLLVTDTWQKLMDECLGYVELTVQEAATKALGSFLTSREDDKQQVALEVKGA